MMKEQRNKDSAFKELAEAELKEQDMVLFEKADKPFLTVYLFIFIFGIFLTIISI